jgi:hypothetical protein
LTRPGNACESYAGWAHCAYAVHKQSLNYLCSAGGRSDVPCMGSHPALCRSNYSSSYTCTTTTTTRCFERLKATADTSKTQAAIAAHAAQRQLSFTLVAALWQMHDRPAARPMSCDKHTTDKKHCTCLTMQGGNSAERYIAVQVPVTEACWLLAPACGALCCTAATLLLQPGAHFVLLCIVLHCVSLSLLYCTVQACHVLAWPAPSSCWQQHGPVLHPNYIL